MGLVEAVALSKELDHVEVKVRLDASAADLAREGSVFWIVRPQVGAGGIRGIDALASGAYIQVKPGAGKKRQRFKGWERMPLMPIAAEGLTVVLKTGDVGGLSLGAPLYYRGFQVGFISDLRLASDAQSINVDTHIEAAYVPLVRQNTHFWKAGGLDIDVSLFGGADIRLQSLRSLVSGGIALSTPDQIGKPAPSGAIFQLHEKPEDEWLEWAPAIQLDLYQ